MDPDFGFGGESFEVAIVGIYTGLNITRDLENPLQRVLGRIHPELGPQWMLEAGRMPHIQAMEVRQ